MKRLVLMIMVLVVLGSCSKITQGDSNEIPLNSNYIFFDSEVSTKAPNLVTDMSDKTFGVVGYMYDFEWSAYKIVAEPTDGFKNISVARADDGLYKYDPLVQWANNKTYTFFAYWPKMDNVASEGTPSITYTMPSWTDPSQLKDVVTAMTMDVTNKGGGSVGLTFKHRLCALVIEAKNFNSEDESISNLKVTINSNLYTTAKIYLDPSIPSERSGSKSNATFQVVPSSKTITVPKPENGNSESVDISGDNAIIFIPQSGMSGKITFNTKGGGSKTVSFTSTKDFVEGKKYYLTMSFVDNAVYVSPIKSGEWTDTDQEIIFE